jgi:heat shock protein HslJ
VPRFDGDPANGVSVSVGRMADRDWRPVLIAGQAVPESAGMYLAVSFEGEVVGNAGCNRFFGTAEMDAGLLEPGPLAATEMACAPEGRMVREAAFLMALGEVRGFVVSPEGLWLLRQDGSVAICLR